MSKTKTILLRSTEQHGPASTNRNEPCLDRTDALKKVHKLPGEISQATIIEWTAGKDESKEKVLVTLVRIGGVWYYLGKKLEK